jgi:hypothetical protein
MCYMCGALVLARVFFHSGYEFSGVKRYDGSVLFFTLHHAAEVIKNTLVGSHQPIMRRWSAAA